MAQYAQLMQALGALAKAPVIKYPESGEFQNAELLRNQGLALQQEEERKKAEKKAKKKAKKGKLIKLAAAGVGAATGGLGLIGAGGFGSALTGASIGGSLAEGDFAGAASAAASSGMGSKSDSAVGSVSGRSRRAKVRVAGDDLLDPANKYFGG